MVGGAGIWTPSCTVIGGQQNVDQLIKSLFADGTQGIYLNAQDAVSVSDLSSIKDLSGRNNHATQANATSRASLITDPSGYKSLKFDGIDDGYVTPSINFSNTDKVTVIAAIKSVLTLETYQVVIELSASIATNNGAFVLTSPHGGVGIASFTSKGNVRSDNILTSIQFAERVISAQSAISNDTNKLKVNGVLQGVSTDQGTGNYGNYPLYIGRRGGTSLPFSGQIYALLVIGKLLDDATTQRIEKEFAKYIGVTL